MAKFNDIKGFIFDLDGVITDTARFHTQAWHQLADKVGAPWSQELEDNLKGGVSRMDSLEMILNAGGLSNNYSDEEKEQLATEKNTNYLALVDQMTPNDILPGIKDFLDSLKANHYAIALASASKNGPRVLGKLELTDYFPTIVDPATLLKESQIQKFTLKALKHLISNQNNVLVSKMLLLV
ncbi:HAD family hydrolase [Lentilactobacillus senioris]|uniref:HAD family hydrolase n=1 Tax=Lentilactobacillus senioris TaxID=931534 RepID=UPI000B11964E|nr:HAD family hydrolase [Lentilactobacillus senioris]